VAADDEPLPPDLEEARKILYPEYSEAEGRALLRAVMKRAGDDRKLNDTLLQRLRSAKLRKKAEDATLAWARDVFTDMDDHTSQELDQVVTWLEAEPARADKVFGSRLEAFQAGLRAGERL
jgi:hypothetical protein